jgi:hypothetical protein
MRIRSGASVSNARASSRIVSAASGPSTSPLRLNAAATSPSRPVSAIASRASRTPWRATSIQWTGRDEPQIRGAPSRSAVARPQVSVVTTSQPASA